MGVIKYHRKKVAKQKKGQILIPPQNNKNSTTPTRIASPPKLHPKFSTLRWRLTKSEKAWSWVPFIGCVQAAKKAICCNHESASLEASYLLKNQACSLTIFGGAMVLGPPAILTLFGVSIVNASVNGSKVISKMKLKKYKQKVLECARQQNGVKQ